MMTSELSERALQQRSGIDKAVLIRTEGNEGVGAGHVRRCLAVASALSEIGIKPQFALSSKSLAELVESRGFPCEVVNLEVGADGEKMHCLLRDSGARMAIIDSYLADRDYVAAAREVCPTFSFGSAGGYSVLSDIMCFYGFHAVLSDVEERYSSQGARCLMGPAYAPLQEQYWDIQISEMRNDVRDVLVTSGGSDPLGICAHIAERLVKESSLSGCVVHVAVGSLFGDVRRLRALAAENHRVVLHENTELIDLLSLCDLAICAGGTTVYEVMRLGVPAVFYSFADNQVAGQDALRPYGHVGDIRDEHGGIDAAAVEALSRRVARLAVNAGERAEVRRSYLSEVDGQGARRVAREIARLIS